MEHEEAEALRASLECIAAASDLGKSLKNRNEIVAGNALSQAMKILAEALPAVFQDLCPSCYKIFHGRLSGIASGLELAEMIGPKYAASADGICGLDKSEKDDEESSETKSMDGSASESSGPPVAAPKMTLTPQERERIRFTQVVRKADFECLEWIKGRRVNILHGLELHTNVFSAAEQDRLLDMVFELQRKGQRKKLKERTYSAPRKWMPGKGRVTLQFGCCYNYAKDESGNPPGILRDEEVDSLPQLLKSTIKRLVRWQVLPPDCIPNSCIVNIYDEGDCIPPHIDHHDFLRPFCTVSLMSKCNILFGTNLPSIAPGQFEGSLSLPLPVGSVLVLNGNGADVAKHCIPAVPSKRVSLTFRKMDPRKRPYNFQRDPTMESISVLKAN